MGGSGSTTPVALYVPNLIGYARAACALWAYYLLLPAHHGYGGAWLSGLALYATSFALDGLDGLAARRLDQCSEFGAVLDMVCDRCGTAGLLLILATDHYFPEHALLLCSLLVLDFSSHWFHMYAAKGHHKDTSKAKQPNPIVRFYYASYPFFGFCVTGTELAYILAVPLREARRGDARVVPYAAQLWALWCVMAFACACKQIVNVEQLRAAGVRIIEAEAEKKKRASARATRRSPTRK